MKKLVFGAAAVAMMVGMYSCGGSSTKTVADGDAIKAKIENCKDPDSLKIYVQQAKDHAMNLMARATAQLQLHISRILLLPFSRRMPR